MDAKEARRRGWRYKKGVWRYVRCLRKGRAEIRCMSSGKFSYYWENGMAHDFGFTDTFGEAVKVCELSQGIA